MNTYIRKTIAMLGGLSAIAGLFLLPAVSHAAMQSLNIGGGWYASWNNLAADSTVSISNVQVSADSVAVDVTASFGTTLVRSGDYTTSYGGGAQTWSAVIDPLRIVFMPIASDHVKNIIVRKYTVLNKTGANWGAFRVFYDPQTANISISPAGSSFKASPFTSSVVDKDGATGQGYVWVDGGTLTAGSSWVSGSGVAVDSSAAVIATQGTVTIGMAAYVPKLSIIPPAPVLRSGSPACGGSIQILWDKVAGAAGYRVYDYAGMKIADLGADITAYNRSGFVPGSSYKYSISAYNAAGESAKAEIIVAASNGCPAPKPTLTADNSSCGGTVRLTWDNPSGATVFKVYSGTTLLYWDTKLTYLDTVGTGVSRKYRVEPYKNGDLQTASDEVTATGSIACPIPTPEKPIVTAVNLGCDSTGGNIKIQWPAVTNANIYRIYDYQLTKIAESSATSYTRSGLTPGQSYGYYVSAVNTSGTPNMESEKSSPVTAVASTKCTIPPVTPSPEPVITLSCSVSPLRAGLNQPVTWRATISKADNREFTWYRVNNDGTETSVYKTGVDNTQGPRTTRTYSTSYSTPGDVTLIVRVAGLDGKECKTKLTVSNIPTWEEE